MAFTKVVGPGIHTQSNIVSHNINSSGIITATQFDGPFSNIVVGGATTLTVDGINISAGILTAQTLDLNGNGDISGNLVVGGNLTANGDFTTLNTTLREVELLRVDANSNLTAGIITQRGSGDILKLYDGTSEVFTVANQDDGVGAVTISSPKPRIVFNETNGSPDYQIRMNGGNFSIHDSTNDIGRISISPTRTDINNPVLINNDILYIGDKLVHWTDDDTAIRFPAANTISAETGGDERARITSAGKLVVSTNTNTTVAFDYAALHFNSDNSTVAEGLFINNTAANTGDNASISFSTDSGNRKKSAISHVDTGNYGRGDLVFSIDPDADSGELDVVAHEKLRIKSDGKVLITNTLGLGGATSNPGDLLHAQSPSGEGKIVVIGATTGTVAISGLNGTSRVLFGDGSTENAGNITYTHSDDSLSFRVNGNTRWKFNSSGHFIPDSAGTYNIGNASKEIGDVYIADDKKLYLGSSQDVEIYHSSGNVTMFDSTTNRQVQLKGDGGLLIRASGNQNIANFVQSGVTLYHSVGNNYTARFVTTSTGITVTGEVAASQDYPIVKPVLDFNFAAEKKLDPRFKFSRASMATFIDKKGIVRYAPDNQPRFDHHPTSGVSLGLLLEREQQNYQEYSVLMSQSNIKNNITVTDNFAISPDGTQNASKIVNSTSNNAQTNIAWNGNTLANNSYAMWSIWVKSEETSCILQFYSNTYIFGSDRVNIELADGTYGGTSASSNFRFNIEKYPNKWWRISVGGNGQGAAGAWYIGVVDSKTAARGATCGSATNKTWFAWGVQEEISTHSRIATSYIPTNGAAVLRKGDRATMDGDDFDDFFDRFQGTVINEHSNALQSIEGGGSGWEFNNDQLQVNLIAQTGSGYAHSHYPGAQASVFGDRNSNGSGGSGSPGTDYIQLYGPNSTIVNGGIQNGASNSGYGRYPGNTGGIPDYTRYYRTWTDAMSYDLTSSTNIIRAATGGETTEGTNTQSISLANVSKFELGTDATDLLYSTFYGRIKRWVYYDKLLPLSQLATLTAQLPQSYL